MGATRRRRALAAAALVALLPACRWLHRGDPDAGCWVPAGAPLCVPRAGGWVQDTSLPSLPAGAGGIVLRLVREGAIAGSPRIDVAREAPAASATSAAAVALDDVLAHGLQEMAALEAAGQIHIDAVDQQRIALGALPAYRVHHEYTAGSGAAQVAINQISTLLVLDGHGMAVTAAGRTELFHPLAESIQSIMDGLRPTGPQAPLPPPVAPGSPPAPVDLGTLGGAPRP